MSDSGAIRAGRAFVELSADDSKLQRSLASVQKKFSAWGSAIAAVGTKLFAAGAAIKAPLIAATNAYAEMGSEMAHASAITGVSVEALSQLKYAAEQSGVSLEGLETGLKKMSRTIVQAAQGGSQATEALARLGVSVSDLASLSPAEKFKLLAQKISDIQDPTVKAATAMEIFGKSGTDLLPLLEQGAGGIQDLMKHADQLGLTMSTRDAKAALEFSQRLKDLWDVVKMGVFTIGGQLAPAIRATTITLTNIAQAAKKFTQEHPKLIQGVYLFAGGLMTAGAALVGLGLAMKVAGVGIGVVSTALSVAGTAAAGIATVVGAIATPLGLVITGLVGAAGAFIYFSGTGRQAVNALLGAFKQIWEAIKFVFENTSSMSEAWSVAVGEAGYLALEGWQAAKGGMIGFWIEITKSISDLWHAMVEEVTTQLALLPVRVQQAFNAIKDLREGAIERVADVATKSMLKTDSDKAMADKYKHAGIYPYRDQATFDKFRAESDADYRRRLADYEHPGVKITPEHADRDAKLKAQEADIRAGIKAQGDAEYAARQAEFEKRRQAAQEGTDLARYEADIAREDFEANQRRKHLLDGSKSLADQAKDLFGPGAGPKFGKFDAEGAADGLTGMMKNTSGGTFNTAAAFGLGGNDVPKHIANIAELTLKQQQDINFMRRQMQQNPGGLAFS